MLQETIQAIVDTVGAWGYAGIFVMMALESSLFPFPSEVVMIPAGYLAHQGKLDLGLVIAAGIAGSLAGALFNYCLAARFGRAFLVRYGRYVLVSPRSLQRMETFFGRHGHVSILTGRLIPGVRQYISLPAGLARMNLTVFVAYTTLGAGLWAAALALFGYFLGDNAALVAAYQHYIALGAVALAALVAGAYVWRQRRG